MGNYEGFLLGGVLFNGYTNKIVYQLSKISKREVIMDILAMFESAVNTKRLNKLNKKQLAQLEKICRKIK